MLDERDLQEVKLSIRLPRHLRDKFKYVVKVNPLMNSTVNTYLTRQIIKAIGEHNKSLRDSKYI